jgi:hypothetical protein
MIRKLGVLVLLVLMGCPQLSPPPPLTAAAARRTLERWNPQYCQVVEFYGFHQPAAPDSRLAYVLLANPKESGKQIIHVAHFQLLTRPNRRQEWYLVSLLSHSAGLSRRQGWDNLFIPVKEGD